MTTWEDEVNTLIRDITSVGFMPKSEARRRITELLDKAREEGYKDGFVMGGAEALLDQIYRGNEERLRIERAAFESLKQRIKEIK